MSSGGGPVSAANGGAASAIIASRRQRGEQGEEQAAHEGRQPLRNARDVYTRRGEGVSIWVVPAAEVTASSPDEKEAWFDPAADKIYRHPTFYEIPDEVGHM